MPVHNIPFNDEEKIISVTTYNKYGDEKKSLDKVEKEVKNGNAVNKENMLSLSHSIQKKLNMNNKYTENCSEIKECIIKPEIDSKRYNFFSHCRKGFQNSQIIPSEHSVHTPSCTRTSLIICSCSASNFDPLKWYEEQIAKHRLKYFTSPLKTDKQECKNSKRSCNICKKQVADNLERKCTRTSLKLKKILKKETPEAQVTFNSFYMPFYNAETIEPRCFLKNREKIVKLLNKTNLRFRSKFEDIVSFCFCGNIMYLIPWIIKKNNLLIEASKYLSKESDAIPYYTENVSECGVNIKIPSDYKLNTKCPCDCCKIYSEKRKNIIFSKLKLTKEETLITYRPFRVLQHYSECINVSKKL